MPTATVLVYSDYKSPYAYVHKAAAYQLERDFDVALHWLPYTLDIPSYLGSTEDRSDHQWRRVRYSYMDARRFANQQGLVLRGPRKIFDSRLSQIGMLFAQQEGVFRAYHDLVFERFWKRELDIEDPAAIGTVLSAAGANAERFVPYAQGEGGADHDRIRGEAEAAGVFGVPMFVLNEELFWGGDRIPLLRDVLTHVGRRRA
jgi:2-hydroxychromene-2-carboxylate isomerase